ncbi:MAG: thiosulfohydrolase SoxB [Proteobacteria bacterium]|nr:thiosulfohydrolase SoxB [Pseudomonadota bacterium]
MLTRRDFLQVAAATAALGGAPGSIPRLAAQQRLTQDDILRFEPLGQITLLHFTDIHAQLVPLHFREPSWNLGVGEARGVVPHLTGRDLLKHYAIAPGAPEAYALTDQDFVALAAAYGRIGGVDRLATLIKTIRAERPHNTILLDGGDTWQGSYTSLVTRGADMVRVMNALGVEAMTGHWDFTYGQERVKQLIAEAKCPFLAGNVRDATWGDDVFDGEIVFERQGIRVGVIGQAFPYTPIANPRYLIPDWSFGINEDRLRKRVEKLRAAAVDLVVLLSHNGFDVDRKLARRVRGIDVILTGHTHDALPDVVEVDRTLLIASGSHGKFLSRLDLLVKDRRVASWRYKLMPVFADAIRPDPEIAALIGEVRAPHAATLDRVVGHTESLLYRRGNFAGTFDDLICQALLVERDAQISLSPGFRWGSTLLPGAPIRVEDIYSQTAVTYPNAYRSEFTGAFLKDVLEDVADNLFNPDPYYQQGGDMVRVGGLSFTINVGHRIGQRIADMRLLATDEPIDPAKNYVVAGWASVNEGTQGPPVWDILIRHIERHKVVRVEESRSVKIVNA